MATNRKLVLTIVMLVVVALAMSPAVNAKGGGAVKLSRGSHDLKAGSRPTSFGRSSGSVTADICAEGWCSCSYCECYGTFECCVIGCVACWEYRDDQGYCAI